MEALSAFSVAVGEGLARFWPGLSVVGGILSAFAAGIFAPVLQQDKSFDQIRDWARQPGLAARYRDLISSGLHFAGRFYGDARGLSWRGYLACLLVAFVYPLFLWQLAWVVEGPAILGGTSVFDETRPTEERWSLLLVFWAAVVLAGFYVGIIDSITGFVRRVIVGILSGVGLIGSIAEKMVRAVVAGIEVVSVGAGVAAVGIGFAFSAGGAGVAVLAVGAGVTAVVSGFAVVAGVEGAAFFAGAAAVVAGFAVVAGVAGAAVAPGVAGGEAVIAVTLLILIPTANAVLDHLSVQVSRWLLSDLVDRRGAAWQQMMIVGHVVADVILAGLFLVLLALMLPAILQGANTAFAAFGWPLIEWPLYLQTARDDPLGKGLLVTGMLATTLIPTVLHLLAAGGALALPAIGGGYIEKLADKPSTTLLDRTVFVGLIAVSVLLSWAGLVVVAVILWEAAGSFVGPLGNHLADLAETVGRAIGGPGAPAPFH